MEFISITKACILTQADGRREDRRLAIIDAAESLFQEQGFERTSLAAIIRRSGGSLATVYEMFGNKQGLLRAVVERRRDDAMREVGPIVCGLSSCADMLRVFGCRLYAHMTAPLTITHMRVVIGEAISDPEFGRTFHQGLHQSLASEIANTFADWTRDGRARIDDPMAAAELYLAIIFNNVPLKAMMAIEPPPVDDAVIHWRLAPFIAWFGIN